MKKTDLSLEDVRVDYDSTIRLVYLVKNPDAFNADMCDEDGEELEDWSLVLEVIYDINSQNVDDGAILVYVDPDNVEDDEEEFMLTSQDISVLESIFQDKYGRSLYELKKVTPEGECIF